MKKYLIYLFLIFAIFAIYHPITNLFYQQDEWLGYGLFLNDGVKLIFESTNGLWSIVLGQGRILTNSLLYIFYNYFPFDMYSTGIFSIVLHLLNALLVFKLAKKIFRNILTAFFGSLFFAFNSLHISAISWFAASVNTLPSTTLILIGLLFYYEFLSTDKYKWMFLSFVSLYMSLFFKESGIFLFLLIPVSLVFYKKINILQIVKNFWYFLLPFAFIVLYRLYGFKTMNTESALFATGASKYFLDSILFRSFFYPLTSFSLSILHPSYMLDLARYVTNVIYPFIPEAQFILVAQTVVLDLISIIVTFGIMIVIYLLSKYENFKNNKYVIFWILFLILSFLPYVIISKSYSFLESRYYYLSSIAWAMIITWIANFVNDNFKYKTIKIIMLGVYILFIGFNIKLINKDLSLAVTESQQRVKILNQIKDIKPKLDSDVNVFYVTGDTDYYIVGNKVPFQQGFGYTLLSYYFKDSNYPKEFLSNTKLFEIGSQGYYEINGQSFGYFTDKKLLDKAIKEHKINRQNIVSIFYNSKLGEVVLEK